jgi:hypothetical protein
VVDRLQRWAYDFLSGIRRRGIGIGFSIAGHIIIALLLLLEIFARIEPLPATETPVEIVIEKPPQTGSQKEASSEQKSPADGLPTIADDDKRARAPLAALNVNGVDRPKLPGQDGSDPSVNAVGLPMPTGDSGPAAGSAPTRSRVVIAAPIGPALPQMTARVPGEDEYNALKEQKVMCGIMARIPMRAAPVRVHARVTALLTEAQSIAGTRSTQASRDRRTNPKYLRNRFVSVETVEGDKRGVALPPGLTVNVGDAIEFDRGYIDPSDSCQFIPNLAVRKL